MINTVDIKKAIISLLRKRYPEAKCYGADVKEGLRKPAFNIQLIPSDISGSNYSTFSSVYLCTITYFQKKVSEVDMLSVASEVHRLFGLKLQVKDRHLNVSSFRYDLTGENGDLLQMSVEFEFLDAWEREEEPEVARRISIESEAEV